MQGEALLEIAMEHGVDMSDQVPLRARGKTLGGKGAKGEHLLIGMSKGQGMASPRTEEAADDRETCSALLELLELRASYAAARRGDGGGDGDGDGGGGGDGDGDGGDGDGNGYPGLQGFPVYPGLRGFPVYRIKRPAGLANLAPD